MENENIVSVMLSDTSHFIVGDNYRFCLVLIENMLNDQRDLTIGCSNQTTLKQIEYGSTTKLANVTNTIATDIDASMDENSEENSDISSFEKIAHMDTAAFDSNVQNDFRRIDDMNAGEMTTIKTIPIETTRIRSADIPADIKNRTEQMYASRITSGFDNNFYPGIFIGILIAIVFALVCVAAKLSNSRRLNNATVCYAAADQHSNDIENCNRYLKLQATTTL